MEQLTWFAGLRRPEEESSMRRPSLPTLTAGLFFLSVSAWSQTNGCDLNLDGKVDTADVQAAINMSLGVSPCTANIAGIKVCNVVVVQRVINASLGGACINSTGLHSVSLTWVASTTPNVTYNVYRATSSGEYSSPLASSVSGTRYTDGTVQPGQIYYYVITAVSGSESPHSKEIQAVIPIP
jgi:hypothetical protein